MLDKNISYFFSIYTFYSALNADLLGIKETYRRFYMTCLCLLLNDKKKAPSYFLLCNLSAEVC